MGILSNPENKDVTISDIHKFFIDNGEKYDYKAIHKQMKNLEKWGVIELKKKNKEQGKPIHITIKDLRYLEALKLVYKNKEISDMFVKMPNKQFSNIFLEENK